MRLQSDQDTDLATPADEGAQNVELLEKPAAKLSGESDRIGRNDGDENTPFGKHVGFVGPGSRGPSKNQFRKWKKTVSNNQTFLAARGNDQ